jgi:hypothetical protein
MRLNSFAVGALALVSFLAPWPATAKPNAIPALPSFYRELTLKIRKSGDYKVAMPDKGDLHFNYQLDFAEPVYQEPIIADAHLNDVDKKLFFRDYWDRVMLKDGSYLELAGEKLPLTCVFIRGQDNRYSGKSGPLLPDFIIRVYLVANDFTCQGPIHPGWPQTGGRKDAWDTYLYFEVRDPTIMLPMEPLLRYRWNEYSVVLLDHGQTP